MVVISPQRMSRLKLFQICFCFALFLSYGRASWLTPRSEIPSSRRAFAPRGQSINRRQLKGSSSKFRTRSSLSSHLQASASETDVDLDVDDDLSDYTGNSEDGENELESRPRIDITSTLELPFPAEVAYDAFSDLPRQPSWSSWLRSVDYITDDGSVTNDPNSKSSLWTLKKAGIKFSWTAISTKNERPNLIKWESTSGLKNFGTVQFEKSTPTTTTMTMNLSFVTPRVVAGLFNRSKSLKEFVRTKMIDTAMEKFRDVVLETDLAKEK